jgi:hypothetical protein
MPTLEPISIPLEHVQAVEYQKAGSGVVLQSNKAALPQGALGALIAQARTVHHPDGSGQ